jgi:hypothetical protein
MKTKFCCLWALFAYILVAIVWPSSAHAQDYTDPDGFNTYMYVARVTPGFETKLVYRGGQDGALQRYQYLLNFTKICQEGGGQAPGYAMTEFRVTPPSTEARCELLRVVTAHTVNSIQDAYKKDVLDGINHMPQQLKDELRRVAEPEIESEVRIQVLSQLSSAKPPGREFSWLLVLIAAAVGAVVGAGTATTVMVLRK